MEWYLLVSKNRPIQKALTRAKTCVLYQAETVLHTQQEIDDPFIDIQATGRTVIEIYNARVDRGQR